MREELGPKIYVGKRSQKCNKSDKERWCHSNRLDWYAVPSSGQKKKKKVVLRKNFCHSTACIVEYVSGGINWVAMLVNDWHWMSYLDLGLGNWIKFPVLPAL